MNQEEVVDMSKELVFPYIYGTLAFSLGKKGESATHKWICYVRGVNNEDLSYLIKKVVFVLHSSFQNPIKEILRPPYEIQEVGWGEFQIQIQIHFNHPNMPHIQVPHLLRLHHSHTSASQQSKKPLCSETYDEIVFTQIDDDLLKILEGKKNMNMMIPELSAQESQLNEEQGGISADQPLKSITQYSNYYLTMDGSDHKNRIEEALRFIKGQVSNLQQKMRIADIDILKVYQDLYNKAGV